MIVKKRLKNPILMHLLSLNNQTSKKRMLLKTKRVMIKKKRISLNLMNL